MEGILKKKYLNVPVWIWIPIVFIPFIFYSIYCYSDIIWTTKNGLTVWYILFDGKSIGEFYATPYPLDSNVQHAYYDFFIYIIFAIWDLPLFIYEKITGISFMQNYLTLWYAKSIILPFLFLCAHQTYKLAYRVTQDKEKAGWSVFSFVFSVMVFQAVIIMGGYDVISLFFTLCGINAYLQNKNKKFLIHFACAIACKMFALWIFIPLVLIRWKKVLDVLSYLFGSISFILVPKLYFILYEKITGRDTLIEGVDTTISSSMYIDEYLWSSEAPIVTNSMPWFFFFTFLLWVACWFYKKQLSDKMIVYVSLLAMSIFVLTCDTHPQWIILVVPYIAILECTNWNNLSAKLFLEVCCGISAILWQVRRRPQCFSYNIVNNMLRFEEGDEEFWFTGIWVFVSKLADVTQIQIEHIWTFVRSILVASFIMLLYYLMPRNEDCVFAKEGNRYFYLKTVCSILVLGIPMLGVFVRVIFGVI